MARFRVTWSRRLSKRAFDLSVAVPMALATAPLVAALAVAVRLTSRGPAFFGQTRVGRGGAPFRMYKLRTMIDGADRNGALVTGRGDRRITALGRLLRATKLDELPQLWSVVRGDMSLVGPRPEVESYVRHYRPEWRRALEVRPGITDRASIAFRDEEDLLALAPDRERAYLQALLPIKMQLVLDGLERDTMIDDLSVLGATLGTVLRVGSTRREPAVDRARAAIAALKASETEAPS